jgi:hypothetical protein
MERDELELFRTSLAHAVGAHTGAALDAALDELGWGDALAAEPATAIAALFPVQGAANATSSALERVVLGALGVEPGAGVVLPAFGGDAPPGAPAGEGLAVRGLGTARLGRCETAVVVTGRAVATVATVATADLSLRAVEGVDPAAGLVEVTADGVAAVSREDGRPGAWAAAVAAGQLALAHELAGASRAVLGLAREHALERVQFGRPIATFQAVRHRLAESLVAIEAAEAAAAAGAEAGTPLTAVLAKAIAGRSARTVARHGQQVLAGIGFTTEHGLHRHVRRILVLDGLFGSSRTLTRRLGHTLLADRRLPSLLPL